MSLHSNIVLLKERFKEIGYIWDSTLHSNIVLLKDIIILFLFSNKAVNGKYFSLNFGK